MFPLAKDGEAEGRNGLENADEATLGGLTRPELLRLVRTLNTECRGWCDAELLHCDAAAGGLTMRPADLAADLAAGIQRRLLHHFVRIEGARIVLRKAMYVLERGDEQNAAHLLNEPRGEKPEWGGGLQLWRARPGTRPKLRIGRGSRSGARAMGRCRSRPA